ncbi:MAG: PQQ-binding-like beta-propeller repeat protein [Oryzomonas sp.]|uniref:outer membrane protein assembly factor BamB family protein n=1 Tax=Oryzomonas sp. TaxID=2855186 RepID=UPI00283CE65C|nr:PQQ-binding-like beta-propeller repeat protein [Oryzomonas sp.]MDR3580443.1 PQQ-binding-like beta-propeller repeat protein [Oryzomonas sp.]
MRTFREDSRKLLISIFLIFSISALLTGCSGGEGGDRGGGPTPTVVSISPNSAAANGVAFVLTVNGSGFEPQSVVQWNGSVRPTTYISPSQLIAQIPATDIVNAGTAAVTVSNATLGEGTSTVVGFTILVPPLALTGISPTSVSVGGSAFVMTATGTGFNQTSVLQWNGSSRITTYVSPTELTAQITAADIAGIGTASVSVYNPGASGATSTPFQVSIAAPSKDAVALQINAAHTGVVNFNNVSMPPTSTWSVNLGGVPSYALIAGGKVFVTVHFSSNSQLVALDQVTGATVWGPISIAGVANAAYDNNTVFVVSDMISNSGLMQAFDAATGMLKWSTSLTGQYMFSSPPTAANGFIYTGGAGSGGTVYAVNQSNGAIAWTQGVANGDDSAPAVSADGVYVTYPCQTYSFNPSTGETIWHNSTGCDGGRGATPLIANGVLYAPDGVGAYSGVTFNAETGALLGSYVADNPPAIDNQNGYFLQSGTLRGTSLTTNFVLWSFAGDGKLVTSPIVVDSGVNSYVFVGSSLGNLYALNAATGAQLWSVNVGAAIPAGPGWGAGMPISSLAAGDGLLLVPAGNTLTAYTLSTAP